MHNKDNTQDEHHQSVHPKRSSEVVIEVSEGKDVVILTDDTLHILSLKNDENAIRDLMLDKNTLKIFANATVTFNSLREYGHTAFPVNFSDLRIISSLTSHTGLVQPEDAEEQGKPSEPKQAKQEKQENTTEGDNKVIYLNQSHFKDYPENQEITIDRSLPYQTQQIIRKAKGTQFYHNIASDLLRKQNRADWAEEEHKKIYDTFNNYEQEDECLIQVGWKPVIPLERALLTQLLMFRREIADETKLPSFNIINNKALVEIVMSGKHAFSELRKISGINMSALLGVRARKLSLVIQSVREEYSKNTHLPPKDSDFKRLAEVTFLLLKHNARVSNICQKLIANFYEIQDITRCHLISYDYSDVRVMSGWRNEIFGKDISPLMTGEKCIRVVENKISFQNR